MPWCSLLLIIWAAFHYYCLNYLFKRYSFLKTIEVPDIPSTYPFKRNDYKYWNFWKFYFWGLILFPLRIFTILIPIPMCWILIRLGRVWFGVKSYDGPLPPRFINFSSKIVTISVRILLVSFGVWWVEKEKRAPKDENLGYFEKREETRAATIIANHSSFLDILIMLAGEDPICFISNHHVKNYFLVGEIAQAIQCIYLNRMDKDSKAKCFAEMKNRIEYSKEHPNSRV